jgi:hypothetical protein
MNIRTMKLADLTPADYNPRVISEKAKAGLRASIERFGVVEPIIYNQRTGHVVGGHQRLSVLLDLGEADTQVVVVDLPIEEEKALNLTLNNQAIQGEFTAAVGDIIAELEQLIPGAILELQLDQIDFPSLNDIAAEYQGMPEYKNEDLSAYRQIIVSFRNDQDAEAFGMFIGQQVTNKTRSLWYPAEEALPADHLRFVEEP